MWLVRDLITGRALTFTMDIYRAEKIASGFEQLDVQRDYGADDYYWHVRQPRLGHSHPVEVDARAQLQAEVGRLAIAYLNEVSS
jgi:hypothetical protein